MGVAYHAHARFLDAHGRKVTVPAPGDLRNPGAPWWYDWIATNAASLRHAGFTAILYPPVCKTQSGSADTGDGYGVFDQYDIGSKNQMGDTETRFGSREQLQRSIAVAHACGLDVYIDVVLHQLIGGNNGVYRYRGAGGVADAGRFPKNPGCFRGAPPRRPQDPVPVPSDDFAFGDELVYVNCEPPGYTAKGMVDFGDWLTRSLDVQGFRVDDTKGMAASFVREWMNSKAMAGKFCVSEYFDGNPQNLFGWRHDGVGGRSAVFDFTTHFSLQAMCDDPGFDMRRLDGAGFTALDPFGSVTFVDNPDTDLSPGEQIIGNKLLAYAFILTIEGYPFVYHKDYSTEPGCYGLKPWIDNLVWIHEHLAAGSTVTRHADAQNFVYERQGDPGLLTAIGKDTWARHTITCPTSFGAHVELHDYTGRHPNIRTDGAGRASFTVPSNAFGRGQSYLCFSRTGRDAAEALHPRRTTQTFFGAADLDTAPAENRKTVVGRVWAAAGTPIAAGFAPELAPWPHGASIAVTLEGPGGVALGRAEAGTGAAVNFHAAAAQDGWHSFSTAGTGLPPQGVPFALTVSYTGTQRIGHEMSISVLTRAYTNARDGANTGENVLTAAAVKSRGIRRLFSLHLPGDARGAEAQPLIVAGVRLPGGRVRDLVLIATMANKVFAFDADDGTPVWEQTLATPINGSRDIDAHLVNDHWGILSTPVVDGAAGVLYACAWASPDGSVANARHSLHALAVADGHAAHPPLDLEGAVYDPGHGLPVQRFASAARKQRASLLLSNGTVFIAFGSVRETGRDSRGWILACDTGAWRISAAWAAAARGFGGGIWQAGSGLAADGEGHLYCMTGNGTFDAETDWAECFLKLRYAPPAGARPGSLAVVDWWTPWTDAHRAGPEPLLAAPEIAQPTNLRRYAIATAAEMGWDDMDLGSGGPVLIADRGLLAGAGKDGILFVLKTSVMGKTQPADLAAPAGNYARLAAPAIWLTFYPGPQPSPMPADLGALNHLFFGRTHHQHGAPVYWRSTEHGPMLFCWGENGNLRAWSLAADGAATYLACSAEVASENAAVPPGGMPGGMICLSADGASPSTAVLWAAIPYLDANMVISPGRLLGYDATQFGTFGDGSRQLRVLWDSQDWNLGFSFCKFTPPVVANGRLYVPTYDARVDVYGLA